MMICSGQIKQISKRYQGLDTVMYFNWVVQFLSSAKIFYLILKSGALRYFKTTKPVNLMDAKCRWCSDWLDGAVSFREPLGQTKVIQILQGEILNHQGAITHEVCCLADIFDFGQRGGGAKFNSPGNGRGLRRMGEWQIDGRRLHYQILSLDTLLSIYLP